MKKGLFTLLLLIITVLPALAVPTNTTGPWGIDASGFKNLSTALTSTSTSGKTVIVSRPMSINNKTVTDRNIKVLFGGKINPAADKVFNFGQGATIDTDGKYPKFGGAGTVTGLNSVEVSDFATGGSGTAASPWTGWDSKIQWTGINYHFTAGYYSYSSSPAWAKTGIKLIGDGVTSTILNFTGSGNCFNLAGTGQNAITLESMWIKGNSLATNGIFINDAHRIYIKNIRVTDVTGAGLLSWASVLGTITNFRVSYWEPITGFTTIPANGIILGNAATTQPVGSTTAYTINDPIIEGISGSGIKIANGWSNTINGGTSEDNGGYGLELAPGAYSNTVNGLYLEANDSLVSGVANMLVNLYSYPANTVTFDSTSSKNIINGGTYNAITLNSGSTNNQFSNVRLFGALTDNGTTTEYSGVYSNLLAKWLPNKWNSKVHITGGAPTPNTGAGITTQSIGHVNRQLHIVTLSNAALSTAGLTADKLVTTIPNRSRIVGIIAETTIPYTGGGVSAATLTIGTSAGANNLLVSHNVFSGVAVAGLADSDLGSSLVRSAAVQGGYFPTWDGSFPTIYARLTTTGANTDALTAGSTTFYITTEWYGW